MVYMSKICSKCQKICLEGALNCPICGNDNFIYKLEGENMVFGKKDKKGKEKGKEDFECKINFKNQGESKPIEPEIEKPKEVEFVPKPLVKPEFVPEPLVEPKVEFMPKPLVEPVVVKPFEIHEPIDRIKPDESINLFNINLKKDSDEVIKTVAFEDKKVEEVPEVKKEIPEVHEITEVAKPEVKTIEEKPIEKVPSEKRETLYDTWQRRRQEISDNHPVIVKFAEPLQIVMISPVEVNSNTNIRGNIETAINGAIQNDVRGNLDVRGDITNKVSGNIDGNHIVKGEINNKIKGDVDVKATLTVPELQNEILRIRDNLKGESKNVEVKGNSGEKQPKNKDVDMQILFENVIEEQKKTQTIIILVSAAVILAVLYGLGVIG